jgi:hypothetical protein
MGDESNVSGTQDKTWPELQYPQNSGGIHPLTEGPRVLRM